jgi:hypothetical protein
MISINDMLCELDAEEFINQHKFALGVLAGSIGAKTTIEIGNYLKKKHMENRKKKLRM